LGTAGDGSTYQLHNVQNLAGGAAETTLIGDGGNNVLESGIGNTTLIGGAGNNTLDGSLGVAAADYAGATEGVVVDLSRQIASDNGYGSTDTLLNISNVIGSAFDDTLVGDGGFATGRNVLEGSAGNDTLIGLGTGSFATGSGSVTLIGGAGNNSL